MIFLFSEKLREVLLLGFRKFLPLRNKIVTYEIARRGAN